MAAKAELPVLTVLGHISSAPESHQPYSIPPAHRGNGVPALCRASPAWVCPQPCPFGRAHCWPESAGKGGDLALAAFEKAQGGQRTSAQNFWESQPCA